VSVPTFGPRVNGWKRTVTVTLPPGGTVNGSPGGATRLNVAPLVTPENDRELTFSTLVPVFRICNGRSPEELRTVAPKASEEGVVPMIGAALATGGKAMQRINPIQRQWRCTLHLLANGNHPAPNRASPISYAMFWLALAHSAREAALPATGMDRREPRRGRVRPQRRRRRTGTSIRFSLPAAGAVGVRIYGAGGRLLRRLDDHLAAGPHQIRWDGKDDQGRAVLSGILFYEVTANGARLTGRMVRLGS